MCAPNNKYPIRPEVPHFLTDIDDPLNFIPTDLREQEIQPHTCPRCGQSMTEDEATGRQVIGLDGPYIRVGIHDRCAMIRKPKRKLEKDIVQPQVKVILRDRNRKAPEL